MRQAEIRDYEVIAEFYKYVIEHTKDIEKYARWV